MEDTDTFLAHYRSELLTLLDTGSTTNQSGDLLEFVDRVLDDWTRMAARNILKPPQPSERTFWFALYQLEEIAEQPATLNPDPYLGMVMENLVMARELLREGRGLPDGYFATRPGEDEEMH